MEGCVSTYSASIVCGNFDLFVGLEAGLAVLLVQKIVDDASFAGCGWFLFLLFVDLGHHALIYALVCATKVVIGLSKQGRTVRCLLILWYLAERQIHLHLVLLFVEERGWTAAVEQFVEDAVELPGHSVLQISAVDWILLHLAVRLPLENVAQETVVGLLETLEVVLEHLIFRFQHLHLS